MFLAKIRREEWAWVGLMFLLFFLVISTFWILKPLKTALFLRYYNKTGLDILSWHLTAAQAEQVAKLSNMVVALVAAGVFAVASRWLRRQHLVYFWIAILVPAFLIFAPALAAPEHASVWSFYLFGDLYNSAMVVTFFAFLNDSVDTERAKRLYGPIVLGGVAGGALGTLAVRGFIGSFGLGTWMWICAGMSLGVAAAAAGASQVSGRWVNTPASTEVFADGPPEGEMFAGSSMVMGSRYLLAIAAMVTLYELASAIMDYQFKAAATHLLDGPELDAYLADVYFFTNAVVAVAVQLFASSQVMSRFGVGAALLVLPMMTLGGSAVFCAAPMLLTGGALNAVDKGLSYSIQQSAKEALYVPTSWHEKYRAKGFIDMFVQRTARALAVLLGLGLSLAFSGFENLRWLSLATAVIAVIWLRAALYAGREFRMRAAVLAETPLADAAD